MAIVSLTACLLAAFLGCACARDTVFTEETLYASDAWRGGRRMVIVEEQASLPKSHIWTLTEWLSAASVPMIKVRCDAGSTSDLCTLLGSWPMVARRDDHMAGVKVQPKMGEKDFTAEIMESLIGSDFKVVSTYNEVQKFLDKHPQTLLALARGPKGAFKKYLLFLKATLLMPTRSLPVVVAKNSLALPLGKRPPHSKGAKLIIWLVSHTVWCPYSNSTSGEAFVGGIQRFFHRMTHPLVHDYSSKQQTRQYSDAGLFTVYVFHTPSKKKWAKKAVDELVKNYCNFFIFLLVDPEGDGALRKSLYLQPEDSNLLVVVPPIEDMSPSHISLDESSTTNLVQMLMPIQEDFMKVYSDNPDTGKKGYRKETVVLTDPRSLGHMAVDSTVDMLVAFCEKGYPQICGHFEQSIQSVADIITSSVYYRREESMKFLVVESATVREVQRYGVDDFPHIAFFNATSGLWKEVQEENFGQIIETALGVSQQQPVNYEHAHGSGQDFDQRDRVYAEHLRQTMEKERKKHEKEKEEKEEGEEHGLDDASNIGRDSSPPPSLPPSSPPPPSHPPFDHSLPPSPPTSSSSDSQMFDHRSSQILTEDDHFGQLEYGVGEPNLPADILLSDATFGMHINSHSVTLVVFYVRWEPLCTGFLHHVLQAVKDFPEESSASMAVLNCGDYPSLCSKYSITHYPTALIFKGSPNDWINYTAVVSSRELLRAVDAVERGAEAGESVNWSTRGGLPELRVDTLPLLLTPGDLSSAILVLWSQEEEEEEGGGTEVKEVAELRDTFSEFTFAWINCKSQEKVLKRIFPHFKCRSVLLLDFSQHSVYELSRSEWESGSSLREAAKRFLHQFKTGALKATGDLMRWVWSPPQPHIAFPSSELPRSRLRAVEREGTSYPSTPPPSSPPSFSDPPSTPPPPHHHRHTEL